MNPDTLSRLREFIESEARSCSMDPGCITPEYVYRMWGGAVPLEEIESGLRDLGDITDILATSANSKKI